MDDFKLNDETVFTVEPVANKPIQINRAVLCDKTLSSDAIAIYCYICYLCDAGGGENITNRFRGLSLNDIRYALHELDVQGYLDFRDYEDKTDILSAETIEIL